MTHYFVVFVRGKSYGEVLTRRELSLIPKSYIKNRYGPFSTYKVANRYIWDNNLYANFRHSEGYIFRFG